MVYRTAINLSKEILGLDDELTKRCEQASQTFENDDELPGRMFHGLSHLLMCIVAREV
jgi:hypothetical protein